jgi:hypothetical protein
VRVRSRAPEPELLTTHESTAEEAQRANAAGCHLVGLAAGCDLAAVCRVVAGAHIVDLWNVGECSDWDRVAFGRQSHSRAVRLPSLLGHDEAVRAVAFGLAPPKRNTLSAFGGMRRVVTGGDDAMLCVWLVPTHATSVWAAQLASSTRRHGGGSCHALALLGDLLASGCSQPHALCCLIWQLDDDDALVPL